MTEAFTPQELEFIEAIERYKAANNKAFLSWTEVLKIVEQLGYRRAAGRKDDGGRDRDDMAPASSPAERKTALENTR